MAEGMGRETVNRRLNGGGGHQIRLVAVAPGVEDLQGDFAALTVYRVGHYAVVRQL